MTEELAAVSAFPLRVACVAGTALALLQPGSALAASSDPVATDRSELEEIIVTAQKRSENIREVPISISVVDGEQLSRSGAAQLADFGNYVPGMLITGTGVPGRSTITVRGIAPSGASATVGTYIDDAPVGSSSLYARALNYAIELVPYDIEHIEVLRGPQGTLYGASSIGGLLKYVTVRPNLDEFSATVGADSFDIAHSGGTGYSGQAMVNGPLVAGKLAATASYYYRKTPGYVDGVETGKRDQNSFSQEGGRLGLLWQVNEDFSVRLSALLQKVDGDGNSIVVADRVTGEPIGDGYSSNNLFKETFEKETQYYAATIDYDLGFASLNSATTYSRGEVSQYDDYSRVFGVFIPLLGGPAASIVPFTIKLDLDKVTQEFRLTSPTGGRFEWLLGAFYTDEESGNFQQLNTYAMDGTPVPGLDPLVTVLLPSEYQEYAAFGNATFKFNDRFDITGGLRWARNKQDFSEIRTGPAAGGGPGGTSRFGSGTDDVTTYSVSTRFHLTDDTMIYARVADGYRPGGPNVVLPGVPPYVDPETLVNYEVGLKSTFADSRIYVDAAVFYMDWSNIQIGVAINGIGALINSGAAVSQGAEASITWAPLDALTFGVNGAYTDANLDNGDRLGDIPRWTGSLTADYTVAINENLSARLGAGIRHTGERLSGPAGFPNTLTVDAFTAADLNADLAIGERWTLGLYVRNLTDEAGQINQYVATDAFGTPFDIRQTLIQPRTVGLRVQYSF